MKGSARDRVYLSRSLAPHAHTPSLPSRRRSTERRRELVPGESPRRVLHPPTHTSSAAHTTTKLLDLIQQQI